VRDTFRLRTVRSTIPMDFAFPDNVQNASLTLVLSNPLVRHHGLWGAYQSTSGERIPESVSFRASLRVTF